MEPIVNPALIYLIGTVDNLKELCFWVSLLTWVWIVFEKMNGCVLADDNLPRDWELDEVCEDD